MKTALPQANTSGARPTFVLVHGAWYGGWCWRKLVPLLSAAGCDVHTPTLTGLGDRAHLGGKAVRLQTHVQDLRALLHMHDLSNVLLVGHSYGGMVISLLAEHERSRLRHLIYLDAFVPDNGKRVVDYLLPLERRDALVRAGRETGVILPIPAQALGVTDPADLTWMNERVVSQPFGTFDEPADLPFMAAAGLPRTYLACVEPASGSFGQFAAKFRDDPAWNFKALRTGHNAMVTAPEALARVLLSLA
jgi:pimeloyl-ACP methyl ester carboxylesterase